MTIMKVPFWFASVAEFLYKNKFVNNNKKQLHAIVLCHQGEPLESNVNVHLNLSDCSVIVPSFLIKK